MKNILNPIINYWLKKAEEVENMPVYNFDTLVEKADKGDKVLKAFHKLPKSLQKIIIKAEAEKKKNPLMSR